MANKIRSYGYRKTSGTKDNGRKKVAISFTTAQFKFINGIAKKNNISFNETVRRAVEFAMGQCAQ